jgi:hypothetical protein
MIMSFKTFLTESPGDVDEMSKKLDNLKTHEQQLNMIYQWVKTGHCSAAAFRQLVAHVTKS